MKEFGEIPEDIELYLYNWFIEVYGLPFGEVAFDRFSKSNSGATIYLHIVSKVPLKLDKNNIEWNFCEKVNKIVDCSRSYNEVFQNSEYTFFYHIELKNIEFDREWIQMQNERR